MNVTLASTAEGAAIKRRLIELFEQESIAWRDVTPETADDFLELVEPTVLAVLNEPNSCGILIDGDGVGTFMAAAKYRGIVAAALFDEHSARMTREHNNANVITLAASMITEDMAVSIVRAYLRSRYTQGRHQIRADMLARMGQEVRR